MSRFHHPDVTALVLAAGQGTRMKSDLAKVLHVMAGRPLLAYVLDALTPLGLGRTLVVVGHQRERVQAAFAGADLEWVTQTEQRGTGHAVRTAGPALGEFEGTLLIVYGDTPLLRPATLHGLLDEHRRAGAAATVLSMRVPDPHGYGRIVRAPDGSVDRIVEERDANAAERAIDEVNSGIIAFEYPALTAVLADLTPHNEQGEYYLTDTLALLRQRGSAPAAVCASDYRELLGINTVEQLAEAEALWLELEATKEMPHGE